MDNYAAHSTRFTETPPESPKSCMKGARRLNFSGVGEEEVAGTSSAEETPSPKRSAKTVMIKSPGSGSMTTTGGKSGDIQFQFHLSQHYDNPPPPPNCTSNGSYAEAGESSSEEDQSFAVRNAETDPQLVEIASKFVNDIIEKAKHEAVSRHKADVRRNPSSASTDRGDFFGGQARPWFRRAQGAISKWVTNLCVRAQNAIRT